MPMWWLRDACFFLPLWPLEARNAPLEWRSSIETECAGGREASAAASSTRRSRRGSNFANGELQGSLVGLLRAAGKC